MENRDLGKDGSETQGKMEEKPTKTWIVDTLKRRRRGTGKLEERLRERWRINTWKDVGVLQGR
jgi:hypothetical protein